MTTGRINQVAQEHWHDCLQPLGIHSSQHASVAVCYSYSTCRGLGLPSVLQPQLHAIITTNSATNDDESFAAMLTTEGFASLREPNPDGVQRPHGEQSFAQLVPNLLFSTSIIAAQPVLQQTVLQQHTVPKGEEQS